MSDTKVLTDPRTDARALPRTTSGWSRRRWRTRWAVQLQGPLPTGSEERLGVRTSASSNNSKISDHFAIIRRHAGGGTGHLVRRSSEPSSTTWSSTLPRGFFPAGRVHGDDAHHASRRPPFQDRGQGAVEPGWLANLRGGEAVRSMGSCEGRVRRARWPPKSRRCHWATRPPPRQHGGDAADAMEGPAS